VPINGKNVYDLKINVSLKDAFFIKTIAFVVLKKHSINYVLGQN
jgi:hypothetical protein